MNKKLKKCDEKGTPLLVIANVCEAIPSGVCFIIKTRSSFESSAIIKHPAVYIMTNKKDGVLYTGVTSDLYKRIEQHKCGKVKGFTERYQCKMLVFYECHDTMESAILREKQIKAGSRQKKIDLIVKINPLWKDLSERL